MSINRNDTQRMPDDAMTVLVVDDDPTVRRLETRILRSRGYRVLEAENATEGLRLAREAGTIHLLVTDFSMPVVDGLQLARQFREAHPKTPVLMVSGSLPSVFDRGEDLGCLECLAKPFGLEELLCKVRELLHTQNAPFRD